MSSTLRAWVRENNPNVYVKGRFDVTHIPKGDHDCRLGVKKSSNQVQPDGSKKVKKVSLFGYGTGVAACTDPATIRPFPSLQEFPPAAYPRYHDAQT